MLESIKKLFKDYFLAGILLVGPFAICVLVFKSIVEGADSLLQTAHWAPLKIPGLGILIAVAVIIFVGFLGKNYLGKYVFNYALSLAEKIPVFGGVYKSLRQVFATLFTGQEKHFSRTVIIPFPNPTFQCIAFVTSETVPPEVQKLYPEPMLSVFVPNSPLPTNGFYLYVAQKDTKPSELTVEQALKIVVSIGLVVPDGH